MKKLEHIEQNLRKMIDAPEHLDWLENDDLQEIQRVLAGLEDIPLPDKDAIKELFEPHGAHLHFLYVVEKEIVGRGIDQRGGMNIYTTPVNLYPILSELRKKYTVREEWFWKDFFEKDNLMKKIDRELDNNIKLNGIDALIEEYKGYWSGLQEEVNIGFDDMNFFDGGRTLDEHTFMIEGWRDSTMSIVEFLEQKKVSQEVERRGMGEEVNTSTQQKKHTMQKQMEWLGTQKELGELFIELKKKGWIKDFEYDAIKAAFTKSNTIQQVLKPGQTNDRKAGTKEPTYDQVYTAEYSPQFYGIKEIPKSE